MNLRKIFSILSLTLLLSACSGDRYVTFSGYAQGGTYNVKINMAGVRTPQDEIAATIDSLLTDIDFSISGYNHNSLLSRRNAGEDIVPDGHFAALLDISEKYLRDSREGKTLNFNAIAQGYSCDVVASYLYSIGVEDMLVDIGEIYCDGLNPSGEGWRIGIDNPVDGNNSPGKDIRAIWSSEGRACGIVTSGNYRKFYIKDGRKYAHTIDPRTGYPVQHDLLSATIVAPTAAEADALATACMVMGPEKAREFIESRPDVEGYLITSEGVWASSGFRLEE